eukprot:gene9509-biopygen1295
MPHKGSLCSEVWEGDGGRGDCSMCLPKSKLRIKLRTRSCASKLRMKAAHQAAHQGYAAIRDRRSRGIAWVA